MTVARSRAVVPSRGVVPSRPGVPSRPVVPSRLGAPVLRLLAAARSALREADRAETPAERFATAHLAGLRAAAAVLADRARPNDARTRRPTSAWVLLTSVAPELGEWAAYFAAGADKRAAALAGLRTAVTVREADDLLRDARTFLALVETTLGLLPDATARAG